MSLFNLFKHLLGQHDQKSHGSGKSTLSEPTAEDKKWLDGLTSDEKSSLFRYLNAGSSEINSYLRSGKKPKSEELDKIISQIDSALNKAPKVSNDIVVYRAAPSEPKLGELGYLSATRSEEMAKNYANLGRKVFPLKIPKGTRMAPVSLIYSPFSEEVLIQRNI